MNRSIKWLIVSSFLISILTGCSDVKFKNMEDRKNFTMDEIETVENTVKKMDGVSSFKIEYAEGGVYAELKVNDQKKAKKIAEQAFNLMWAETTGSISLFVKPKDDENRILIEAFKPTAKDDENEWTILQ